MALINCPECGKEISDKAASCPHCGYPLPSKDASQLEEARRKDKQALVKIGALLLIGIAAILAFAFWCGK